MVLLETLANMDKSGSQWTSSDSLAVALTCLAAVMALVLFWIEKTPLSASLSIGAILAFSAYPVIHFVKSTKARILVAVSVIAVVTIFGWSVWPKEKVAEKVSQSPSGQPPAPIIIQQSQGGKCTNIVAGKEVKVDCPTVEKEHEKTEPLSKP